MARPDTATMIEIPCPMCGGAHAVKLLDEEITDMDKGFDYLTETGGHYRINRCLSCGFVYSSPVFTEETLSALYDEAKVDSCMTPSTERGIAINSRRYVDRLMEYSGITEGRLLDVGCGPGAVLKAAAGAGLDALGVDPGGEAVSAALEAGCQAQVGLYTRDLFPENSFDLVTVIHVIDHVMSPLDLLKSVHKHLRPGGAVLLATHNIESLLAKLMGKRFIAYNVQHITYYTPDTLDEMIRRAGLIPVKRLKSVTTYPLNHLVENGLPYPGPRKALLKALEITRLGNLALSFPFGNIEAVAVKPA